MARWHNKPPAPEVTPPEWKNLLGEALNAPGRMTETYSRFYTYSFGNQMWLRMQGAREPIASYKGWQKIGRQVVKGASAYYVLRPITVKSKTEVDEQGQPKQYTKFKPVKGAFPYSMTEGEPLPEVEPTEFDRDATLGRLGINLVQYTDIDGNTQGYSHGNNVAINPVAVEPLPTLLHEVSHVVSGHTSPDQLTEYLTHRGVKEFEAEASSYILCNELEIPFNREESRAYIQGWTRSEEPTDANFKRVFKTVDTVLRAVYFTQPTEEALAS